MYVATYIWLVTLRLNYVPVLQTYKSWQLITRKFPIQSPRLSVMMVEIWGELCLINDVVFYYNQYMNWLVYCGKKILLIDNEKIISELVFFLGEYLNKWKASYSAWQRRASCFSFRIISYALIIKMKWTWQFLQNCCSNVLCI